MIRLFTPIDIQVLQTKGLYSVTQQAISEVSRKTDQIDKSKWTYELAGDASLYEAASQTIKEAANFAEKFMSNLRASNKDHTNDVSLLNKLRQLLFGRCEEISNVEAKIAYDLIGILRQKKAGLLHDVCVEHHNDIQSIWDRVHDEYKKQLAGIYYQLTSDIKSLGDGLAIVKVGRNIGPIKECSDETIDHLRRLAIHDHKISTVLNGITYCAELIDDRFLDALSRFPHQYNRGNVDYVTFQINGSTLMIMNNWCIGSDKELLSKITKGEVPKVASTNFAPTVKWAFNRGANIQAPLGHRVVRCTFTSNAKLNPGFHKLMQTLGATPCSISGNSWDIPLVDDTDLDNIAYRLKMMFGFPAKVVQLIEGPGFEVLRRNWMSKIAMPLFSVKMTDGLSSAKTRREENAWVVREGEFVHGAFADRKSAKHCKRQLRETLAAAKQPELPSKLLVKRLAKSSFKSPHIADLVNELHVAANILVLHPSDFVQTGLVASYQPQVGELVSLPEIGVVEVTAVRKTANNWLSAKTLDGLRYNISAPDFSGRQVIWREGKVANPFTASYNDVVRSDGDASDMHGGDIINTCAPMLVMRMGTDTCVPCSPDMICGWDEEGGGKMCFTPTMPQLRTFIPILLPEDAVINGDGQVVNNGRILTKQEIENYSKQPGPSRPKHKQKSILIEVDPQAKAATTKEATDRQKPFQAPGSTNNMGVKDPLTVLIQLTGYNPMFHYPLDKDALRPVRKERGEPSSESSSEVSQDFGRPPEDSQNPSIQPSALGNPGSIPQRDLPGKTEYQVWNQRPIPAIASVNNANLEIVQDQIKKLHRTAKTIRDLDPVCTVDRMYDLLQQSINYVNLIDPQNSSIGNLKQAAFELRHGIDPVVPKDLRNNITKYLAAAVESIKKYE